MEILQEEEVIIRISLAPAMGKKMFFSLLLLSLIILSYNIHRFKIKNSILRSVIKQLETKPVVTDADGRRSKWLLEDGTVSRYRMEWARKDQEVDGILTRLDQMMPNVSFTDINTTTSAKHSKATILGRKDSYCVGEHLMVQLDLYDHLGKRKAYGGDFLRARIHSPHLKAGASGRIEDYQNGTYLVNFTLFWEGSVRVSLLLIHPSEGVAALWAARKKGYEKIAFTGQFLNATRSVFSECGFKITQSAQLCEYLDERDQEAFYCVKPENVPCEALVQLKSENTPISYLTALEQSLLQRSNVGVEIPQHLGEIRVLPCNRTRQVPSKKCAVGMSSPSPSGFVWQDHWHPVFCSVSTFETSVQINSCLKRKLVYFMGDSTVRQWLWNLTKRVSTLKYLDIHKFGNLKNGLAMDVSRSILIQFKKHGHPYVSSHAYTVTDHSYIAREIDSVAGDKDTAVVISLGQHFRPFPLELFVRRLINVRAAIQRLLLRSPETRVIIKAENIREMDAEPERFGDFHGYTQYLAAKDVFRGLNVGMVDAWDMTLASATSNVHPPHYVVGNQVEMFLTYIC
ncbi:NXPE family member 1-like isoform X2 [Hemicordylus capensis]|uniref:NXPE family member 1-like isoform X2 n=1 Tax=Hemicordylus capensis TaxID=884348 RepID=UPI0023049CCE|nr:NXPE family member 1-like isoform X2 [Hemicordylus capensis]